MMHQQKYQGGHTLLEMMLSLTLLSLIMAGVGSAVMFASQAIPDEDNATASIMRDTRAVGSIAEDISLAKFVVEQDNNAVTVIVTDRTGDGMPDQLRYAWSGTPGDPLTFTLNDLPQANVMDAVDSFLLNYNTTTISTVIDDTAEPVNPSYEMSRQHLSSIELTLNSGGDSRQPIVKKVRMLQAPPQLDAYWEAYHEASPSQITLGTDGILGWSTSSQANPSGSLIDGYWTVKSTSFDASTQPYQDVITLEASLRAVTGDGPWILLPITVNSDNRLLPVWAQLRQAGSTGHELAIYNTTIPFIPKINIEIPTQDWVDLKLIVLPEEDLVAISINNEQKGTFELDRWWNFGSAGRCEVYDLSDNVGNAFVRISVGGTYSTVAE